MDLENDGWESVDMLWCQGAQNSGLSNCELKSTLLSAAYDHNACQSQTDGWMIIMAIA